MKGNRIFLGVQEISGMMSRLNNALHEMGIKSDFYCMDEYGFASEEMEKNSPPPILKKFKFHTRKRIESAGTRKENWWYFLQMWDILYIFFRTLFQYDKFVYIFGHGMFFYNKYLVKIEELEFWILKVCKKKMIMWLCGSDSRAPYCDVILYKYEGMDGKIDKIYSATQKRKKRIRMLEKYMVIIDYPASSHFHTKPYILFNSIGMPVDEKEYVRMPQKKSKVTILHAPSFEKGKGTECIRKIIAEMKRDGHDFEYVEVSGMPHNVVLEKMALADIVIDQVYSDTPMAGLATEAAINGIPVIVAGYYAKEYKKILNKPIPPTIYCEPEKLKENLLNLLNNSELREKIGQEERKYIYENNIAAKVADKIMMLFEGTYPKKWIFIPENNHYLWGAGVPKELVIDCIVPLLDKYGTNALGLKETSVLFRSYIELYERYSHSEMEERK